MKRILFVASMVAVTTQLNAQNVRALTQNELNRRTAVCEMFHSAIPQEIAGNTAKGQDCAVVEDAEEKDGKYFVAADSKGRLLSSNFYYHITYKQSDVNDNDEMAITGEIIDEATKGKSADKNKLSVLYGKLYKLNSKKETTVSLSGNYLPTRTVSYNKSIKPEKINLPVPSSYAMLYAMGSKSPIDENNTGVTQGISEFKGDLAIIVIGKKPATSKMDWDGTDNTKVETLTYHDITPLGKTDAGTPVAPTDIQNIEVIITGDKETIEQLISKIDWKKLQSFIGK